jgi:hypothetical protein
MCFLLLCCYCCWGIIRARERFDASFQLVLGYLHIEEVPKDTCLFKNILDGESILTNFLNLFRKCREQIKTAESGKYSSSKNEGLKIAHRKIIIICPNLFWILDPI